MTAGWFALGKEVLGDMVWEGEEIQLEQGTRVHTIAEYIIIISE